MTGGLYRGSAGCSVEKKRRGGGEVGSVWSHMDEDSGAGVRLATGRRMPATRSWRVRAARARAR
jgi:hypothetical protein